MFYPLEDKKSGDIIQRYERWTREKGSTVPFEKEKQYRLRDKLNREEIDGLDRGYSNQFGARDRSIIEKRERSEGISR